MPILAHSLGADDTAKSLLMSGHLLFGTLGTLLNSLIGSRFKQLRLLLFCFFVMNATIVAAGLSNSVSFLFVCMFILGLMSGFRYPTLMGMCIQQVEQEQRSTALGIHQAVYGIGMFIGPWLGGVLAGAAGLRAMFLIIAAISFTFSYVLIFLFARMQTAPLRRD
jgi:MFS family permease